MPADRTCVGRATVTGAEILDVHRVASAHRTGALVLDLGDACLLAGGHGGDCAAYVASLGGYPASAWLRWYNGRRRVDWLADCPVGNCALFLGHPGDCDDCGVPGGNRRWVLQRREPGAALTAYADEREAP